MIGTSNFPQISSLVAGGTLPTWLEKPPAVSRDALFCFAKAVAKASEELRKQPFFPPLLITEKLAVSRVQLPTT